MKILFVTLSNIGDCILTLPVLDVLREKYPQAKITCLVPPRPSEIFVNNPVVDRVVVFDKHVKLKEKINLFLSLNKEKFDLVVDLRNSFFGAFLAAKKRTSPLRRIPKKFRHMKDRHLFWAEFCDYVLKNKLNRSLVITSGDRDYIAGMLKENNLADCDKLIVVAPGSRSQSKCWDKQNFSQLCRRLVKEGFDLVLVGDKADQFACSYVQKSCPEAVNLCARTSISQLAALLKKAKLLLTNDSAVMHLASYLDVPVAAIFGPTDEAKYGPWSKKSVVIKKDIFCRPCQKAQCRFQTLACLAAIKPDDVFLQIKPLLEDNGQIILGNNKQYRRILISRTDRMGDVLLSTPVIQALRESFPQAYIAMMVTPYARDIVEGNPYLDEVILYDKDGKHKSWVGSLKFAGRLKKKKFDLAIVLYPNNRVHLITFLAGINQRLGYDRNFKFLLTDQIKHTKQYGEKHESEYALDLVRYLGVKPKEVSLFMPIKQESEEWANALFREEGIKGTDRLLVIHPTASCDSRIWPAERYAQVAEKLIQKYGFKVCIVSGGKDIQKAKAVVKNMRSKVVDLIGKTSISQVASLLKRSQLFISTDSGPMHVAVAFGVPVVTIFGRKQPGLSPKRWGPLGKQSKYLHKDVGCIQCLAHNCKKEFACLKAISVDDVVLAVESILK
ncbi:MAG: lipopolysaccharide heptosyltransferase II [Candidatus Omnitrophota bacterium]